MKNRDIKPSHNRQQLRHQFYEIHEAEVSQPSHQQSHESQSPSEQPSNDEEYELCDKNILMKTTSTEVLDSKFGSWEEPTLREIEEKSEREEGSNGSGSIQKFVFCQRGKIGDGQNRGEKAEESEQKLRLRSRPSSSKRPKKKKKTSQLVVSLQYSGQNRRTYRIGMKILNKQWFKALDSIHKGL